MRRAVRWLYLRVGKMVKDGDRRWGEELTGLARVLTWGPGGTLVRLAGLGVGTRQAASLKGKVLQWICCLRGLLEVEVKTPTRGVPRTARLEVRDPGAPICRKGCCR